MLDARYILENLAHALESVLPGARVSVAPSGSTLAGIDAVAEVRFGGQDLRVAVEAKARASAAVREQAAQRLASCLEHAGRDWIGLMVAPYLGPRAREQLRDIGVNFLDLSGNAWIRHDGILVDRQGFANKFPEERAGRDPFADKASLILRALLREPGRTWGIREMASVARLDPGFVSRMARELHELGYAQRVAGKLQLRDAQALLDDWAHAYSYRRNRMRGYYLRVRQAPELLEALRSAKLPENAIYALSLQAGAHLVDPYARFSEVHAYVQDADTERAIADSLDLKPAKEGANVWLMSPYYRRSAFDGLREAQGLPVVSDVQLYLDLYNYPLRGREQAEHLYEAVIAPGLLKESR